MMEPCDPEPIGPFVWTAALHSLPLIAVGVFILILLVRPPARVVRCHPDVQRTICGAAVLGWMASLGWSFCNGFAPLLGAWFFGCFG